MTREQKEQLYLLMWAKRRLAIKNSFYQFFIDSFPIITNGEKLESNWHIEYLCAELQVEFERWNKGEDKTHDIIINVPPRTLKSSIVSVAFPAWCWIQRPDMKFIGTSYSSTLSIDLNVKTRRLIESDWYQKQFTIELTGDQNAKGNFENSSGGFRKATSTGGSVTGTGCNVCLIDDPLNPEQANSKTQREEANNHFDNTLSTRLNNGKIDFFIVIMQRLHQNDLTGYLMNREPKRWKHICLPAEYSPAIKPFSLSHHYVDNLLFPQRLSQEVLNNLKSRLGSYNYSGQFKQLPADPEGGIIKRNWFQKISVVEFLMYCETNKWVPVWDFFLDTAYTADKANDPTAILTGADHNNNLYVKNVTTGHMEFPELIKFIPEYVGAQGYTMQSRIYVEPKASGKSTVQQLKRSTSLNIIESEPPKEDKLVRATAITPIIETGRVFLIEGDWNGEYLDELADFPRAIHDDRVDVTVMAINKKLVSKKLTAGRTTFM